MNSLFAIFDPVSFFSLSLNWLSVFFVSVLFTPSFYWISKNSSNWVMSQAFSYLYTEIKLLMGELNNPGHSHFVVSVFFFIVLNNFFGLFPYVFTASSHLTFSLSLALMVWISVMIMALMKDLGSTLAHLVPLGTPYALMPLMVLIEVISNVIRPITLSVRLAANMVAGHLLLTLIGSSASFNNMFLLSSIMVALFLMLILESAVAIIQSYVFSTLSSLYLSDVNSMYLSKLKNKLKKLKGS